MALYALQPHFRSNPQPPSLTDRPRLKPYRVQLNVQVLAEVHFDNYDFDLSLTVYHEQTHLFGTNAKIYFNIGQIHLLLGELRESASWFRKAIATDNFLAVAYFQLGAIYTRLGDFTGAGHSYYRCRECVVRPKTVVTPPKEVGVRWLVVGRGGFGGAEIEESKIEESVSYDQVGLRYTLFVGDIEHNQRVCETLLGVDHTWPVVLGQTHEMTAREGTIETVPAGAIFRVPDRKARGRVAEPAKTAEWRFRNNARVVAEA